MEFGKIIDFNKETCIYCDLCEIGCKYQALKIVNNELQFNRDRCVCCFECEKMCPMYALKRSVHINTMNGEEMIAVTPTGVDLSLITHPFKEIITTELAEKVINVETASYLSKLTEDKLQGIHNDYMLFTDVDNLFLILKNCREDIYERLYQIKNSYIIASYLYNLSSKTNLKKVAFGMTKSNQLVYEHTSMFEEVVDDIYTYEEKYNLIDTLKTYMRMCHLVCSVNLDNIDCSLKQEVIFQNKYISMKALFISNYLDLIKSNLNDYDFVFFFKKKNYEVHNELLKDQEINEFYKKYLKAPLSEQAFFKK